jgi:hypothetical protein
VRRLDPLSSLSRLIAADVLIAMLLAVLLLGALGYADHEGWLG